MLIIVDIAEIYIIPVIVNACHRLYTTGATERHGMHVAVKDTLPGELVDVRRFVGYSAVAAECLGTDVVRQYEYNIRALVFRLIDTTDSGQCQRSNTSNFQFLIHYFTP